MFKEIDIIKDLPRSVKPSVSEATVKTSLPLCNEDRFGMAAKILVFGSEGTPIESSFIGSPGRAMRTAAIVAPSIHRKDNQAIRHMTLLSRHTHDDATNEAVALKMTQLLTRSPRI
ncbi:hypothetical protein TNCV_1350881 [Trichonephila clavipes]|nr:hypothetical protein TNCV_1350881 [Trichonephila clavipes]